MQEIKSLENRIDEALNNEQLHANFRSAMSYLMEKRRDQFPDEKQLNNEREVASTIRSNSVTQLPELLIKLEENLEKNIFLFKLNFL